RRIVDVWTDDYAASPGEYCNLRDGDRAWKRLIVPAARDGNEDANAIRLAAPTSLLCDAHAAGLAVHAWTFRSEPRFLAADYDNDPTREYQQFMNLGIDG